VEIVAATVERITDVLVVQVGKRVRPPAEISRVSVPDSLPRIVVEDYGIVLLYDMHGNLEEWCSDYYGDYPRGRAVDPKGPEDGLNRVTRGGSWFFAAILWRAAERRQHPPDYKNSNLGMRVVLSKSEESP
jgi:hypothetical protein